MDSDTINNYYTAKKLATKSRNTNQSQNIHVNLLSLDDITAGVSIISEVSLGLKDIPLRKIVGTQTHSRATSFAPNFMPLMHSSTEFAEKWRILYAAQITEGIRDPIKVVEYLNKYYVVEGNKRVSVLKFLDAYSIPGTITRLIPRYDENNKKIVVYYSFLDFSTKTGVDFIWFSEPESYNRLYKWVKKYNWKITADQSEIKYFYQDFREIYHNLGGNKINITTGDAFIEYLDVYTYDKTYTKASLRAQLKKMWNEFYLLTNEEEVQVETTTDQLMKRNILTSIVGGSASKLKVAFINSKSPSESLWTYDHEMGRQHIQNVFKEALETTVINNVSEDEHAYDTIKQLAEADYDVIFTTAPTFIKPTLKAALEYSNVKFLNCSENMSYKNIRTYFGRIYEPNFLVGMIAGSQTKTSQLGYVATYPVPEVINCINAFALGARFVNPQATVQVKWVDSINYENAEQVKSIDEQLASLGIDIVLHEESADFRALKSHKGIYCLNDTNQDDSRQIFAAPIWNWGIFYEKLISNILSGSYNQFSSILGANERAINYWWGMNEGVVDILYSPKRVPQEFIKTINFMKRMIISGEYKIFSGPLYDNKNELIVPEDGKIDTVDILKTNWFVKGVKGSIPTISNDQNNHPLLDIINTNTKLLQR